MDKRVIVGLLGLAAIGGYYVYMSSKPPTLTAQDYGSAGTLSGSYQAPPSSPASGETNNYNFPNVNIPPIDFSTFPGPASDSGGSSGHSGSSGSSGASSNFSSGQSIDPATLFRTNAANIARAQVIAGGANPQAYDMFQSAASKYAMQPSYVSKTAETVQKPSFYNQIALAVPGIPTTSTLKSIVSRVWK